MIPVSLLSQSVTIKRRTSTGRDALNNPTYGTPTSGQGWTTVYNSMAVRLAFNTKQIKFAPEGERILPTGIMYYNNTYALKAEDRVLTSDGIEYNVISVVSGINMGGVVDHFEAILALP